MFLSTLEEELYRFFRVALYDIIYKRTPPEQGLPEVPGCETAADNLDLIGP